MYEKDYPQRCTCYASTSVLKESLMEVVTGGGVLKDSIARLLIGHGCGLFGGALNHPGVS